MINNMNVYISYIKYFGVVCDGNYTVIYQIDKERCGKCTLFPENMASLFRGFNFIHSLHTYTLPN